MTVKSKCFLAAIPIALLCGCSGSDGPSQPGAGGSVGVGGSVATGGANASGGSSNITTTSSVASTGGTPSTGGAPATGGANVTGGAKSTGGAPATGGMVATGGSKAGTGGAPATGGQNSTGGVQATGGANTGTVDTGGNAPTGGSKAAGGSKATGGANPTGGSKAMGGSNATGGSSATGDCPKGPTKGSDVAVIGESFIAASHGITKEIEAKATAAGSLASGDHYKDNSVSGTLLSGNDANAIPKQYAKAVPVKYVLMDGGGNDCLQANNGDAALAAATTLFQKMATDGVLKVQYFFYPDPLGSFASGSLKTCLDALRPKMKALCDGLTAPKCYWLDLRTVWNGHPEYTSDGIHPTDTGSKVTGDAIWAEMVKNCIAQ